MKLSQFKFALCLRKLNGYELVGLCSNKTDAENEIQDWPDGKVLELEPEEAPHEESCICDACCLEASRLWRVEAAKEKPAWIPYTGQVFQAGTYWVHHTLGLIRAINFTKPGTMPKAPWNGSITHYMPIPKPEAPKG